MATIDVKVRDQTKGPLKSIERSLGRLAGLAATAFGVTAINRQINAYQQIQNRLKLVTGSTAELAAAQDKVFGIAQRTRASFEATAELYQKLSLNAANLNLEQEQLAKLTETVNKSIALSGAAGAQAEAGILQLSQAFASGRLSGDEFRSISENIPDILTRIAIATGKPRGELKKLAADGKLTGKVVADSLLATADITDSAFGKLDVTLGQAFTIAGNNLTKFIGKVDDLTGASSAVGKAIIALSENLDKAIVAAGSFIVAFGVGKLLAIRKGVLGVRGAMLLLNKAIKANPIGLIATVIAAATVAAYEFLKPLFDVEATFREKIFFVIDKFLSNIKGVFSAAGNVVSVFADTVFEALSLAFSLENPLKAFEGFGEKMSNAVKEGFDRGATPVLLSPDRYAEIDANVKRVRDSMNGVSTEVENVDEVITSAGAGTVELGDAAGDASKSFREMGAIFRDLLTGSSPFSKAVQDFQDLQAAINEGVSLSEYRKAVEESFGENSQLQKLALSNSENRIKKEIEAELGKYDALRAARTQFTENMSNLQSIENAMTYGAIEFEQEQYQALQDAKVELLREYNQQKLALQEESISKTQEMLLREGDLYKKYFQNRLSQEDRATLQKIGEDEKIKAATQSRIEFEKKSTAEQYQFGIQQAGDFFTALGASNKKAFEAAKAFNIANAIMNTYLGATKALASYPPPFNFIAAAAVVAGGLAQVASIRSQQYQGRQRGGSLNLNQPTVVGEDGPELIVPKQPSTVIPREVADAIDGMGGGKGGVTVNFNITTVDAQGFDDLLIQRRATITGIINNALQKKGKQGVV